MSTAEGDGYIDIMWEELHEKYPEYFDLGPSRDWRFMFGNWQRVTIVSD